MCSKKGRKTSPTGSHVGTIFESEVSRLEQKRGSRNCFEKWYPQESNWPLSASPEAPGDDASRAHFQQQKQQLGQQQQQLQQQLQKLLLVFSFCSKLLLEFSYLSKCLFDFGLKTERMFDLLHLLEHKVRDLTRPGQRPGELSWACRLKHSQLPSTFPECP